MREGYEGRVMRGELRVELGWEGYPVVLEGEPEESEGR